MVNMKVVIGVLILFVFLFGCTQQAEVKEEIVYQDRVVEVPVEKIVMQEKIVEKKIYVCEDLSQHSDISGCVNVLPQKPQVKEVFSYTCSGSKTSDFFYLEAGLVKFDYVFTGKSNIIVRLLDEEGTYKESIINQIGDYSGQSTYKAIEGYYYIECYVPEGKGTIKIMQ